MFFLKFQSTETSIALFTRNFHDQNIKKSKKLLGYLLSGISIFSYLVFFRKAWEFVSLKTKISPKLWPNITDSNIIKVNKGFSCASKSFEISHYFLWRRENIFFLKNKIPMNLWLISPLCEKIVQRSRI